jgi:sulfite oxidase
MNGEPLTPDHGFPLRSVVPGYIGARSVKWLGRIVVSDRPSPNHYVAGAYKLVTEDTPLAWDEAGVIYNYAVNSVIAGVTVESQGSSRAGKVTDLKMQIMGYALPNGDGGRVAKVDVSANNGKTWLPAKLLSKPQPYCWVFWEADVNVPENSNRLLVRATDSKGNTQPQSVPWNLKGYMNNSWHEMPIDGKS